MNKKARSAKRQTKQPFTLPPSISEEIEDRRGDIVGAMSLLYGLHSILKNQSEDVTLPRNRIHQGIII